MSVVLFALLAQGCAASTTSTPDAGEGVFGGARTGAATVEAFPRWHRVVEAKRDHDRLQECLKSVDRCTWDHAVAWREMVLNDRSDPLREKLQSVNRFFNALPHRSDQQAFGVVDRWIRPVAYMQDAGDCEDNAIAKYYTLRAMGVPEKRLRIVVVQDKRRRVQHAVLTVAARSSVFVLNSLSARVLKDDRYRHYQPILAMNTQQVTMFQRSDQIQP